MKRKNIIILMISLSLVLLLGSSYAYLRNVQVGNTPYVISIGTLQVTFEEGTEKLNLTNMYPMSDTEGKMKEEALKFVIKNTGTVEARYNVYLEETSTSPEFKNHIRFTVKKNNDEYIEPKTLKDDKNIDANAYLKNEDSATYQVKVWLDSTAENEYMNQEFKAKVVIEAIQNTNE